MKRFTGLTISLLILITLASAGCGHNESDRSTFAPLPYAWPRIPVSVSDSMTEVRDFPVPVMINPEATYEIVNNDPPGLTVSYPSAGAKIYFTFIKATDNDGRTRIMEARKQRISLNLNGIGATTAHAENKNGATAVIVTATSGTQTPVQLLADLPEGILTATAFIENPQAASAYDSISPLVSVLEHDLRHALPYISFDITQRDNDTGQPNN